MEESTKKTLNQFSKCVDDNSLALNLLTIFGTLCVNEKPKQSLWILAPVAVVRVANLSIKMLMYFDEKNSVNLVEE